MMQWTYGDGLSLLDTFALEAMKIFLEKDEKGNSWEAIATYSYSLASKMIRERQRIVMKMQNNEVDNG